MPAWFEIGFKDSTFNIDIHPAIQAQMLDRMITIASGLESIRKQMEGVWDFVPPASAQHWGFRPVMETVTGPHGWHRYLCRLPKIHTWKDGEDHVDWSESFARCLTLSVLFEALEGLSDVPSHGLLQLCQPRVTTIGLTSWPMSVELSPEFIDWVEAELATMNLGERIPRRELELPDISAAMYAAHRFMWEPIQNDPYDEGCFSAVLRPPHALQLAIPGVAGECMLYTPPEAFTERGYAMHDTHSESPLHQLTLLAGMASICDLIREADPPTIRR